MVLLGNAGMPLDCPPLAAPMGPAMSVSDQAVSDMHRHLAAFNQARATSSQESLDWIARAAADYRLRRLEHDFVESESEALRRVAREAPFDPDRFVDWFDRLTQLAPGTSDPLFPWLAEAAEPDQLRWYHRQTTAADAGFEAFSELIQQRFAPRNSADKARYEHEDSEPSPSANTFAPLLRRAGRALAHAQALDDILWESLAVSNLMAALSANRRYAYQAVGALAASERSAFDRQPFVQRGLERAGIPAESCTGNSCDTPIGPVWGREVLSALVAPEPNAACLIAEGALLRIQAEARSFERYRRELVREVGSLPQPVFEPLTQPAIQPEYSYAS